MSIPQKGTQYLYGKHDMFALLMAFRYLLDKEDFKSLKKELTKLLNSFSATTSVSQKINYFKQCISPPIGQTSHDINYNYTI